jgi:putative membrane protein
MAFAENICRSGRYTMKRSKGLITLMSGLLFMPLWLFSASTAFAQGGYGGWGTGPGMMAGWGGSGFGGIFMLIFWALIIGGVVFLIKWLAHSGSGTADGKPGKSGPMEILKERYARGEINKEEFEERRRILSS